LLFEKLSDMSKHRGAHQDPYQSLDETRELASVLLKEISSPDLSSVISEPDRSRIIGLCSFILKMLLRQPASFDPTPSFPIQPSQEGNSNPGDHANPQPLQGKVVLITRPLSQSQNAATMIEQRGGLPVVIPMIEITEPDDWHPVDHAIVNLKGYDGVIFTSQNGVEYFLRRVSSVAATALSILATRRVYAVGEKTRVSLENAQIPVTLMPERFSASELIAELKKEHLAGKRFLFPKGTLAKEEVGAALQASHAVVDEIEVYKTINTSTPTMGVLGLALKHGEIDAILFFSPSAVQNFVHSVGVEHTKGSVVACIGPSTAEAARSAPFANVIVAPEASAESLVGTLVRYFDR
jgi:uroporphyrinogen III methyltransferase/synthase